MTTSTDGDPARQRELRALLGEIVSVDEKADEIMLTFRDGRVVTITGIGYDDWWRSICISERPVERR